MFPPVIKLKKYLAIWYTYKLPGTFISSGKAELKVHGKSYSGKKHAFMVQPLYHFPFTVSFHKYKKHFIVGVCGNTKQILFAIHLTKHKHKYGRIIFSITLLKIGHMLSGHTKYKLQIKI
jgi:hypothetical protein